MLRRVEFPLAVPLILAGLRTSLVLAVGTATLAFFVNGGGLGMLIDTGYKLHRITVLVVGAVARGRAGAARRLAGRAGRALPRTEGAALMTRVSADGRAALCRGGRVHRAERLRSQHRGRPAVRRRARLDHARCPNSRASSITVGSKDFTEQIILGYIAEFALAAAGADVHDLTNIQGSRQRPARAQDRRRRPAWEYTGTGWINYLGNTDPIPDEQKQYEAVRDEDLTAERPGVAGRTRR